MPEGRFVAYYRVSTDRQGRSGLGLEAQQEAVRAWLNGGSWELLAEVVEVESGRRSDRPMLADALNQCQLYGATLIIAKLDRLARNVAFISGLMEAKVDFVAVDFPTANRLTVHILAAVAEHEAQMISDRTKAALAAAKARGVKLGNDGRYLTGHALEGARASAEVRADAADKYARKVAPMIRRLRGDGMSLRRVAAELTKQRVLTPQGGKWSASSILRILERAPA